MLVSISLRIALDSLMETQFSRRNCSLSYDVVNFQTGNATTCIQQKTCERLVCRVLTVRLASLYGFEVFNVFHFSLHGILHAFSLSFIVNEYLFLKSCINTTQRITLIINRVMMVKLVSN